MEKTKVIGIDPDIEKSGVCYLYTPTRQVEVSSMDFPHLMEYLSEFEGDCNVVVVVEAGWKNSISNFHGYYGGVAQKIALSVGRNQQVGHCIVEMCNFWNIPVVEKAPLRKMWKGKDRKISQEEIEAFIPDFPKRSSQDARDSALLAWDYAGFPIRITPVSKRLITDNGELTPTELIKKMTKKNKNYTI